MGTCALKSCNLHGHSVFVDTSAFARCESMSFFSTVGSPPNQLAARGRGAGTAALPTPRENVSATVYRSRVVGVALPFQTPRAATIRSYMQSRLLNDQNQRLFVWRRETNNLWTNIALNSTPANPVLTAEPAECARKLTTVLTQCPDVLRVILLNEDGNEITAEDVSNMEFTPLDQQAVAQPAAGADDEITVAALAQLVRDVFSKVEEVAAAQKLDMVQLNEKVDTKVGYVIDVLEGTARTNDPARRKGKQTATPQTVDVEVDAAEEDGGAGTTGEDASSGEGGGSILSRAGRAVSRRMR